MEQSLQITYRNMGSTASLDHAIRKHVTRLEAVCNQIIRCRVLVEAPHRHHHRGQLYHVRIDLTVPGAELVVGRSPTKSSQNRDCYVALRDAFRAARRELTSYSEKRRVEVKRHNGRERALVTHIFWGEGYGFLRAMDGHTIYFHANSVVGGLEQLDIGTIVRYTEAMGDKGPQATVVRKVGQTHHMSESPGR